MLDTKGDTRRRLADLVEQRRKSIGLSVSGAARAAGIDRATWTGIERGTRETEDYNFAAVERVLGWAAGSIDAVLEGGDPTIQPPTPAESETPRGATLDDEAIVKVMRSNRVPEEQKRRIVAILIADREAERRRRLALADELMRNWEKGA